MRRVLQGRAGMGVAFLLGLLIATAGTATAARLITGKQIKDGSISAKDLNKAVRGQLAQAGRPGPQGPKGDAGPRGETGVKGDPGPSAAFRAEQSGVATVVAAPGTKAATVTLPEAGTYVVSAQLAASVFGAVVDGRDQITCDVGGSDGPAVASLRTPVAPTSEDTLYTVIGAGALPAGPVSLRCVALPSGGLDPIRVFGGLLTLTRVATLTGN